jgi:hypothetical protein
MSTQQTQGLVNKFIVYRRDLRDSPGGDRQDAYYFVLDVTYDPHSRAALLAYADSCEHEFPLLAADLRILGGRT